MRIRFHTQNISLEFCSLDFTNDNVIQKGNVVYASGGYWASLEYAKMMSEEDVVYVHNVAKNNPSSMTAIIQK